VVRVYEQVDQAAIDGSIAACSDFSVAAAEYNREVEESGTLGSGTNVITANTGSLRRAIHFESETNEPNETSWPAGDWTVRFNVTTGNTNVDLDGIDICRVNSSGVNQATIFDTFFLAINLSAGVKTFTVSGNADAGAAATDRFYIVLSIFRSAGHGSQSATITNDQQIDTPFAALAPPPGTFLRRYEHTPAPNPLLRM